MKKLAIAVAVALASVSAHAQDWFQFEVGVGVGLANDMGDGTWIQDGSPDNREKLTFPVVTAGITGELYRHGSVDVRYHADYAYLGEQRASVMGVPDDQYNGQTHSITGYQGERFSPFNGHGHVQGIPVTLDVGYTLYGWRMGVEAGVWAYWQTWHESLYNLADQWQDLSHKTTVQFGYVIGASVSRGPLSLSYRYYNVRQLWNPNPGLVTGANVVTLTYRF